MDILSFIGVLYSYRRGLRSCLSLQGGKFEGQEREISNEYGSHASFIFCSYYPQNYKFLAGGRKSMNLRDVMDLTRHGEQAMNSAVLTDEAFSLSHGKTSSNFSSRYDALANCRIQSAGILSSRRVKDLLLIVTEVVIQHILQKGKILVAGNGGSASQSQHFCSELMGRLKKRRSPICAISLCADISLTTCIANDFGYERVFSRQIEGLGNVNDVFIAFTTSGKSRNIIEALLECKQQGITTIVFTGEKTDSLCQLADYIIDTPNEDSAIVQETHLQLIHMMSEMIEDIIEKSTSIWDEVLALGRQDYKFLILDRDGVINHAKANGYIQFPSELVLREDFLQYIKKLSETFQYIFVVSNQKGVGKGLMTMDDLERIHEKMMEEITSRDGKINKIYVSTSADNNAADSKPNTGTADKIKANFPDVDFSRTIVVGDSASDYLFATKLRSKFVYARTR